jgi:hypothetical protein
MNVVDASRDDGSSPGASGLWMAIFAELFRGSTSGDYLHPCGIHSGENLHTQQSALTGVKTCSCRGK